MATGDVIAMAGARTDALCDAIGQLTDGAMTTTPFRAGDSFHQVVCVSHNIISTHVQYHETK